MRKLNIFILLIILAILPSFGAVPNSSLSSYLKGCKLMVEALSSHNKEKLQLAIECFDEANATALDISSINFEGGETKPEYLFTADFADEILLNDFSLAKLDPEALLRHDISDSELVLYHLYLGPGESATLFIDGADNMTVSVTSGGIADATLSISDETNNFKESINTTSENENSAISWDMQTPATMATTVKNISDTGATFVVIFN